MRKKLLFIFFFSLCLYTLSFAQIPELTGHVTFQGAGPVVGATITVKGTRQSTISNEDGFYRLGNVKQGATIQISYVGYKLQEYAADGPTLDISISPESQKLEEVVVTALGIKKEKRSLGYAVSEINGGDLTKARSVDISNSLEGKVAGLNIVSTATGPGGSSRITLRGNGSLSGDNQPLIVVDGIPMNNENLNNLAGGAGGGGTAVGMWGGADQGDGISSLNPDEIENISVLKGATAAALYGSRASNGAILVTTKSGSKNNGAIGLELNSNFVGESLLNKTFKDYQYVYGLGDALNGDLQGSKPPTSDPNTQTNSYGAKLDGSPAVQYDGITRPYSAVKDNLSKFYRVGNTWTNSVALSGSSDKLNYRLSLSDLNNTGILPSNSLRRDNVALNLNGKLSNRLSFSGNIKYIKDKNHNRPRLSDSPGNAAYTLWTLPTSLAVQTLKDNVTNTNGSEKVWSNNQYVNNPYFVTEKYQQDDSKERILTSFEPKFNITDWLYVKGLMGFDKFNYRDKDITPTGAGYSLGGGYTQNLVDFRESNLGFIVGLDKKIGSRFAINAIAGGNAMSQSIIGDNENGGPFNIPFFYDVSNVTPASISSTHRDLEKRINSFYGSADFSFNNYLFLSVTGRNDWFSALTPATVAKGQTVKNSIFYPSVGMSFVISDALRLPSAINYAKIRASWAQAGGDTDPYKLSLTYGLSGANGSAPLAQIGPSGVPNSKLKPYVSTTDEIGLEARMINNRLGLDLAVYNRVTTDDILTATISPTSGYTGAVFNVGEISNKGVELMLSYRIGSPTGFMWEPGINFAYNKSLVKALYGELTQISVDNARTQTAYIAQEIGKEYSQLQVVAYKRNAAGQIIFNPSGLPDKADNLKDMGTGVSPYTAGFSNSFRYKNFTLNMLIDGKFGGVMFSGTEALAYRYGLSKGTLPGRETGVVGKGVMEDGQTANTTNVQAEAYYQNLYNFGEPFVYSSDFIKLRSLSLDYSIPASTFRNTPFKSVTVSVVGRNLWTIIKHTPNIDPESTYNNGNAQGLEFTGMPITKTMGINLNVKF